MAIRETFVAILATLVIANLAGAQVGPYDKARNNFSQKLPGAVLGDNGTSAVSSGWNAQPVTWTQETPQPSAPRMVGEDWSAQPGSPSPFLAQQPGPMNGGCGCDGGTVPQGCGCDVGGSYFVNEGCGSHYGCGDYATVFGGWNGVVDPTWNIGTNSYRGQLEEGFIVGTAIGRRISCNRRSELEFAFRHNEADLLRTTTPNGTTSQSIDGDLQAISAMLNTYLETSRTFLGARPYAGVGAGLAYIDADFATGPGSICYIEDAAFSWQLMAGFERQLGPRASFFAEYRYFMADNVDMTCITAGAGTDVVPFEYDAENILIGIRIVR